MTIFSRAFRRRAVALRAAGRFGRSLFGGAPAGVPLFMRTPQSNDTETRIHDDAEAQKAALRAGAHAFTLGEDIFVGPTVGTPNGPTRDEVLRHERVHAEQVRYGTLTGERAAEDTLETEARARSEANATGPVQRVHHGADRHTPHGWFFDDDTETSSTSDDSYSESDSSRMGMQRTIWDHLQEAASGILEVGPIDAYDAAFGEDEDAAAAFSAGFEGMWMQNAARHGVWQARLAFKYGAASAREIGNAHEEGSPNALDSWIDQHNNRVAREIGESAGSLDEIPGLIRAAIEDGRLITSPSDLRIPEDLRGAAPTP